MAKPKPPEELDSFTVRPPIAMAKALRALAEKSGISLNEYCVTILREAAENQTEVERSYSIKPRKMKSGKDRIG